MVFFWLGETGEISCFLNIPPCLHQKGAPYMYTINIHTINVRKVCHLINCSKYCIEISDWYFVVFLAERGDHR